MVFVFQIDQSAVLQEHIGERLLNLLTGLQRDGRGFELTIKGESCGALLGKRTQRYGDHQYGDNNLLAHSFSLVFLIDI